MWPELVDLGIMPEISDFVNCVLHAFNLSYKTAYKDLLGEPVMNNTFQLCYLDILLLNAIKKDASIKNLKEYYSITMTSLLEDETDQAAVKENFIQAFDKLMNIVQESGDVIISNDSMSASQQSRSATATNATTTEESLTDAERKEAAEKQVMEDLAAMCLTNIKEPNFGRWGTISYVAKIVLYHWLPLFYMAQNVQDTEKNGCYLHVIATKLVELMSSKADPKQPTPTHYTSLQWIVGFGEAMFEGNMEWAKRNDHIFGDGSYRHIARLLTLVHACRQNKFYFKLLFT
jgi:hypothetical protein